MAAESFVQLRQAVLGVQDVGESTALARKELGLAPGFADPLLEDIGMADESMILGDSRSYLEFVAPLTPESGIQRWLDKGGPGGYALSIQVSDLAPFLARAAELGLDLAADLEVYGYRIVQLRPRQMGLLVELDEIPDRDTWFWDSVDKEYPTDPQVDSFTSVEIMSADPARQAATWAALFGVEVEDADGTAVVRIGNLPAHFVEGPRSMMSAIGLARSASSRLATGSTITLDGVRLELS